MKHRNSIHAVFLFYNILPKTHLPGITVRFSGPRNKILQIKPLENEWPETHCFHVLLWWTTISWPSDTMHALPVFKFSSFQVFFFKKNKEFNCHFFWKALALFQRPWFWQILADAFQCFSIGRCPRLDSSLNLYQYQTRPFLYRKAYLLVLTWAHHVKHRIDQTRRLFASDASDAPNAFFVCAKFWSSHWWGLPLATVD